jgi:hypothetical protein
MIAFNFLVASISVKNVSPFLFLSLMILSDTCPEWLFCHSATQLKAHAFQPRELVGAGYSVQELTQAGIKGKQLQALGISMDETLNAAWQQGSAAP